MAITVSDPARERLHVLFQKHAGTKALRVGVRGGGCSGYSYIFELENEEPDPNRDRVFDADGVTLVVDPKSYFFLNGSELDFVDELMGARFHFRNPNAKSTCGCGESVSF